MKPNQSHYAFAEFNKNSITELIRLWGRAEDRKELGEIVRLDLFQGGILEL